MEFIKIEYIILEVFPKGQKSSCESVNEIDEDINENSHWIQVSANMTKSNPDLLQGDFIEFIDKITKLFVIYHEKISEYIKSNFSDNHEIIINELNDNIGDSNVYKFDLGKITEFKNKYPKLISDNFEPISNMINISSINNYIRDYIPNTSDMTCIVFEF